MLPGILKDVCFSDTWLNAQSRKLGGNPALFEKTVHAFALLGYLVQLDDDFVFKGGTSLVLLLKEGDRFSIDIDIICKTDREELEIILEKVVDTSKFKSFELDEHRSY